MCAKEELSCKATFAGAGGLNKWVCFSFCAPIESLGSRRTFRDSHLGMPAELSFQVSVGVCAACWRQTVPSAVLVRNLNMSKQRLGQKLNTKMQVVC